MLEKIKLLLGISNTSKDELLMVLIEQATEEARTYTHNDCIADLSSAICNMVIYRYNLLGSEGLQSEGYSGVSFSYLTDYPETIMKQLRAKRKCLFL